MDVSTNVAMGWAETLWGGDATAREGALSKVAEHAEALSRSGEVSVLMAAAVVAGEGDPRIADWLTMLDRPDAEEVLLARWEQPLTRRAGLALGLRHGARLQGGVRDYLLGELDVLDADDQEAASDLGAAFAVLASIAPGGALEMAGLCAQAAVDWLQQQPATLVLPLMDHYAERLAPHVSDQRLPEPVEAHALLLLELLAEPLAEELLRCLGERLEAEPLRVAGVLARLCVGVGLSVRDDAQAPQAPRDDLEELPERLDPGLLRGLLDVAQITYNQRTGDTWEGKLSYKDPFEQRQTLPFFIGLTGRRLVMRITLAAPAQPLQALMRANHYSGLACHSLDTHGNHTITVEQPRDGYHPESFEQALNDLRRAYEGLL